MKTYIRIIACVMLLMMSNACDDSFLDETVYDKYVPESLNDKLGFEAAIVGLHQHFATHYKYSDEQSFINIWHVGTDIVWAPVGRTNGDARPYFDYTQLTSADNASLKVWRWLYRLISNANLLIAASQNEVPGLTEAERNVYNAEARFFRAYAYEMLVTLYGGVPLVTEPLTTPKTDFVRASVAEIDTQVETDLLFCIDNLPKIGEAAKVARANKAMARQVLAISYLRRSENAKAETQLTEIINGNSGTLSLMKSRFGVNASKGGDVFNDLFLYGNQRRSQGNNEVIWVVETENPTDKPHTTGSPQQRRNWGAGYYDTPGMLPADSLGGRSIGRMRLNNWVIYSLWEDNDIRNSKYNLRRHVYFNNTGANYNNIRGMQVPYGVEQEFVLADGVAKIKILQSDTIWRIAPHITKWGQFDPRDTFGFGMWKDFIIMRLGETYLLRAEARFKQANTSGAADDLNEIRGRANATLVDPADVTLDYILDERVRELIGEENRRLTLVRTGTLIDRATTLNGTAPLSGGNFETTNGLTTKHLLMPIPQLEIDLNKDAVLEQNPGY